MRHRINVDSMLIMFVILVRLWANVCLLDGKCCAVSVLVSTVNEIALSNEVFFLVGLHLVTCKRKPFVC